MVSYIKGLIISFQLAYFISFIKPLVKLQKWRPRGSFQLSSFSSYSQNPTHCPIQRKELESPAKDQPFISTTLSTTATTPKMQRLPQWVPQLGLTKPSWLARAILATWSCLMTPLHQTTIFIQNQQAVHKGSTSMTRKRFSQLGQLSPLFSTPLSIKDPLTLLGLIH